MRLISVFLIDDINVPVGIVGKSLHKKIIVFRKYGKFWRQRNWLISFKNLESGKNCLKVVWWSWN